jgi:hypothetical protein
VVVVLVVMAAAAAVVVVITIETVCDLIITKCNANILCNMIQLKVA